MVQIIQLVIKIPSKTFGTLIEVGSTSMGVVIPKSWLRFYNLKKGDKLEIVTNEVVTIKPIGKGGKTAIKTFE